MLHQRSNKLTLNCPIMHYRKELLFRYSNKQIRLRTICYIYQLCQVERQISNKRRDMRPVFMILNTNKQQFVVCEMSQNLTFTTITDNNNLNRKLSQNSSNMPAKQERNSCIGKNSLIYICKKYQSYLFN